MNQAVNDVVPLRPAAELKAALEHPLIATERHLDRCALAANTVKAYRPRPTPTLPGCARTPPTTATPSPTPLRR